MRGLKLVGWMWGKEERRRKKKKKVSLPVDCIAHQLKVKNRTNKNNYNTIPFGQS